jgi:hypothetical protein
MDAAIAVIASVLCFIVVLMIVFVVWDARRRGANAVAWGLVAWLLGPIGLGLWLCCRPPIRG